MANDMKNTVKSLADKTREQAYLVALLEFWNEVEAQGFDPEEVATFTLWPAFFSAREKLAYQTGKFTDGTPRTESKVLFYNALRLKDGSLHKLDPMLRRR